jgi:RimJ/RimL family protein N-acetyltransferase
MVAEQMIYRFRFWHLAKASLEGGHVEIFGTHIVLRDEKRDADEEDLFHWLNLEEWSYYDEPDKPFKAISREEFQRLREERQRSVLKTSTGSHIWQIDTHGGTHIGWASCYRLDEQAKQTYVGVCLPEERLWGSGYGTEPVALLIDHLFAGMELKEIRAAKWTGNNRMVHCAEKCGFSEIGHTPH